jgi:hypothetical protein
MSLILQSSGGGSVTIAEPVTASNFTQTLQAATGTVVLNNASDQTISGLTVGKGGGSETNSTVVGKGALASTNTVGYNTAFGSGTLAANTSGSSGVAIGFEAATANTTGDYNTVMGSRALYTNTTGASNTALGYNALRLNTTASNNTAVGFQAGYSNTTGTRNTFLGEGAGYNNTNSYNVYVGNHAGYLTTGTQNTFIGDYSGSNITTGSKNTIIGKFDGNLGGLDIRTASNYAVISDGDGNPMLWCSYNAPNYGLWSTTIVAGTGSTLVYNTSNGLISYSSSSLRYKQNIQDAKYGLADVEKMRSVTFNYISDNTADVGFIAEEMVNIIPEIVGKNKDGEVEYINYDKLTSILVKAIQELNAKVEAQALEIAILKGQ